MARDPERVTAELLKSMPLPKPGGSKHERGTVLVVGGARRTPGAVALTGLAALRVGAGRLTLAVADSTASALAVAFPEAGVIGLPETSTGSVAGAGARALAGETDADCVVVGPGLDDADEARMLLQHLVPMLGDDTAVLLDAFALGALAADERVCAPLEGRLLLTPNTTEATILLGHEWNDPLRNASELAERYGAVVTCNGVIADRVGGLWQVESGGPGLGTSGSGDVLAGAAAGLMARGTPIDQAACWGTHLHARAGDRLARNRGSLGFLARELADALPNVLFGIP